MKKAILAALTFIVVGFLLADGTLALPDLDEVFAYVMELGDALAHPTQDESGIIAVALVSDDSPQQLYPGGAASRTTAVRNEGTGEVYFRLCYAIQYNADSWHKLTITFAANEDFEESDWLSITIDGTPYQMKVFTYKEALAAGAASPDVKLTIAMDDSVTSEEIIRYRSDFLQTQVLAIDPTHFTNVGYTKAVDALDRALPISDTFNPF